MEESPFFIILKVQLNDSLFKSFTSIRIMIASEKHDHLHFL